MLLPAVIRSDALLHMRVLSSGNSQQFLVYCVSVVLWYLMCRIVYRAVIDWWKDSLCDFPDRTGFSQAVDHSGHTVFTYSRRAIRPETAGDSSEVILSTKRQRRLLYIMGIRMAQWEHMLQENSWRMCLRQVVYCWLLCRSFLATVCRFGCYQKSLVCLVAFGFCN